MGAYISRRLLLMVPTIWGVVTLVFIVMRVIPGDVARNIAGVDANYEQVEEVRVRLRLDRPILEQYVDYMKGVVRGDLGKSIYTRYSVVDEFKQRLPNTILLSFTSLFVAVIVGVSLGTAAAAKRGTIIDYSAMLFAATSLALPNFVFALLLVFVFSEKLRVLPAIGAPDLKHIILPVVALSMGQAAVLLRMTRATLLDVLHSDYIRTARAKGLPERTVLSRHALRNSLIPVVTVIGLQAGFALGGSVVIETIFAYPGVGRLIVTALNQRDYTIVQGSVLMTAGFFVLVNLAVDMSYAWIDPRIRFGNR